MATRTSRLAQRFQALDRRLHAAFARRLRRFFADQAERVIARYLGQEVKAEAAGPPPLPEELLPDDERQRLWLAMLPFLLAAITESANLAGDLVGLTEMLEQDPRIAEALKEIAMRVNGIHRTTLGAIRATLADGLERGYSAAQIAHGVPEDGFRGLRIVVEVYSGRVATIVQTELVNARQLAALDRYQEAGLSEVRVSDGTEPTICGWMYHNDPDRADGSRRTLIAARAYPLAHPHCRRVFMPVRKRR